MPRYPQPVASGAALAHHVAVTRWALAYLVVVLAATCYFIVFTDPYLAGETSQAAVVADSITYMNFAGSIHSLQDYWTLVDANRNLGGMLAIAKVLGNSTWLMFAANAALVGIALAAIARVAGRRTSVYIVLLFANPMLIASLTSLNKEIVSTAALMFAGAFVLGGRSRDAISSVGVAALARLELALVIVAFLALRRVQKRSHRWLLLAAGIGVLTFALPLVTTQHATILAFYQSQESGGLTATLHRLANDNYLFALVIPVRFALNLFEGLLNPGFEVGVNFNTLALVSSVLLPLSLGLLIRFRRLEIRDDLVLLAALVIIATSSVPFVQHRYVLPLYAIACLRLLLDGGQRALATVPRAGSALGLSGGRVSGS